MKRVIVIGAGLGGLSAAIHLAAGGIPVEVFEQNGLPGGKMAEHRQNGFRFDTGPSLLTMPFIFDTLFKTVGKRRQDYLDFEPVEPVCRYFYPDGSELDTFSDIEQMIAALEAFSPGSGRQYKRFLRYTRHIYEASADVFLFSPFQEWRSLLQRRHLAALVKLPFIDPLRTMHASVSRFFTDARLIQLFDRYATYNGSDPFRAPATLNIIPWVEFGLGGYYIRVGMFRLTEALQQLSVTMGVHFHFNQHVEKIRIKDGTVQGVDVSKRFIPAEAVVCNGDVVESYRHLLPPEAPLRSKMEKLEPSLSGLVFLWGVGRQHSKLAHHNIFFSKDYRQEFIEIFDERKPPSDPTVYVSISSKSDPEHAPAGKENWFVLVNMPYLADGQDWPRDMSRLRETVLQKLARSGFDISDHIESESTITPIDFYRNYASNRGSIYGISSNSRMSAFLRPANRSRDYRGLYFAGGSTHPGGGIPLVLLSGKMAAQLLQRHHPDLKTTQTAAPHGRTVSKTV